MQAAVLQEFGPSLTVQEVARPQPGPDDVLLQVEACGVCHSDLHVAEGDQPPLKAVTKPHLIPGHEVVGRVVERGANVTHLAIGDRVGVAWLHATCGECEPCREGRENLCRRALITGVMVDGGYAEYMVARASHALKVPDALTPEAAAPLFCAGLTVYRALKNAGVAAGQKVAIVGVGGLGHLAVQIAKAWGAHVIALDVDPAKLELARQFGADQGFNAASADDIKALRKQGGVHVAVVTSAAKAAYDTAFKCLRPAGTLSVVGLPAEPLTFAALSLVGLEAKIVGSSVGTREDMRAVLDLAASGKLRCLTESQPLDRGLRAHAPRPDQRPRGAALLRGSLNVRKRTPVRRGRRDFAEDAEDTDERLLARPPCPSRAAGCTRRSSLASVFFCVFCESFASSAYGCPNWAAQNTSVSTSRFDCSL